MNMQYYKMEQDLFGEIEKEKKFSLPQAPPSSRT